MIQSVTTSRPIQCLTVALILGLTFCCVQRSLAAVAIALRAANAMHIAFSFPSDVANPYLDIAIPVSNAPITLNGMVNYQYPGEASCATAVITYHTSNTRLSWVGLNYTGTVTRGSTWGRGYNLLALGMNVTVQTGSSGAEPPRLKLVGNRNSSGSLTLIW